MKNKKRLLIFIVLSVPVLFYLNVWQAFRYEESEAETERLEIEQQTWLESNKKVIIGIEVLGSPARIDGIAREMDYLEKTESAGGIRIDIRTDAGDGDG
ncbi:MAG: cell division protein FtsL [Spirochaetales bacterium]|nr:cell division protein FtsL [Spirochaetales bacterium]